MKRSKRLLPIIELSEKKTQSALIQFGKANDLWVRDTQQLNELHSYKQEYLSKLREDNQLSVTAHKVLELRRFLTQLDQAILAQQAQVKKSLKQRDYYKSLWVAARSKEQAMQTLSNRYQHKEQQQELKQEMKELDERNTAQWLRNR